MTTEPKSGEMTFAQILLVEDLALAPEVPLAQLRWLGDLAANRDETAGADVVLSTGQDVQLTADHPDYSETLAAIARTHDAHAPAFFELSADEQRITGVQTPRAERIVALHGGDGLDDLQTPLVELEFDPWLARLSDAVWDNDLAREAIEDAVADGSVVFCARGARNAIAEVAIVPDSALVVLDRQISDAPDPFMSRLSQSALTRLFDLARTALLARCDTPDVPQAPRHAARLRLQRIAEFAERAKTDAMAEVLALSPHLGRSDYRAHHMAAVADEEDIRVGKVWVFSEEDSEGLHANTRRTASRPAEPPREPRARGSRFAAGPGQGPETNAGGGAVSGARFAVAPYVFGPSGTLRVIDPTLFDQPVDVRAWQAKCGIANGKRYYSNAHAITVTRRGEVRVEDWDATFSLGDELIWLERDLMRRQIATSRLDLFAYGRQLRELRARG